MSINDKAGYWEKNYRNVKISKRSLRCLSRLRKLIKKIEHMNYKIYFKPSKVLERPGSFMKTVDSIFSCI